MAFPCGTSPDDGDETEIDEQPTLPSRVQELHPAVADTGPEDLYAEDKIIKQAYARYLERDRRISSLEFCPVCWRYARARGVEDNTIYLYPRPCQWHAQAITEAKEPATKVWLIQQYREALKQYLWPPGLRQAVDGLRDGGDDGSADDGNR